MARGKSPSGGFGFDPSKMANDPTMSQLMKRLAGAGISKPRRELDPEELLEEWQDGIDALIDSHPLHKQKLGEKVKGSVELKTVNRDRGCELVLRCGASIFIVLFDICVPSCGRRAFHTTGLSVTIVTLAVISILLTLGEEREAYLIEWFE